jgi:phosphoglycerate dehydrogenase-like enzyme
MKILITPKSFKDYKDKTYHLLEERGYTIIENSSGKTLGEEDIMDLAGSGVVGIIVGIDPLPARVLRACADLRAISKYGVGMDNIDLAAAAALGIRVKNAVGSNTVSVAELTFALIFEAARHVSVLARAVKDGHWDRVKGFELTGKQLVLLGGGQIGKEVAKRGVGLGMKVSIFDPYLADSSYLERYGVRRLSTFEEALMEADILSIHLPLTEATRHILGSEALGLMKPSAVLINTSRGELVDEIALYAALKEKRLAFAAQDVFSSEPPARETPLLSLDTFILTPHTGAYTAEGVERMALYSTQNLIDLLEG